MSCEMSIVFMDKYGFQLNNNEHLKHAAGLFAYRQCCQVQVHAQQRSNAASDAKAVCVLLFSDQMLSSLST